MEAKYDKAMKTGFGLGLVILCFVALLNSTSAQCITFFGWAAIILLLVGVGVFSVREARVATLKDAIVVSVVAGITAGILNAIGLIVYNAALSIIDLSIGGFLTSIVCWTPLALFLGVIFPVIGGGLWHVAYSRGLVK